MKVFNAVLVVCIVWTSSVCSEFYQPTQPAGYQTPVHTQSPKGYHPAPGRYSHLNILLAARNKQLGSKYHPQSVPVRGAPYRPNAHYQPEHVNPYHANTHRRGGYRPNKYSHLNIIIAARKKQLAARYHPQSHPVNDAPYRPNAYQQPPHVNPHHANTHRRGGYHQQPPHVNPHHANSHGRGGYRPNRYSHLNILLAAREKQLKSRYHPQSVPVHGAPYRPSAYRQRQPVQPYHANTHVRGGYHPNRYSHLNILRNARDKYQNGRYDPHGSAQHRPVYLKPAYSNPQ